MNASNNALQSQTQTFNAPQTSAPSIASSAMISELSISQWTGRILDPNASADVAKAKNADANVARVHKDLLGKCDELRAVQKFVTMVRNSHLAMTMPWSDSGLRLLPTAQYFKYHNVMTQYEDEFNRLTEQFIHAYDTAVIEAQLKLGDLFNPDEYPTVDAIRRKFAFRLSYVPIPDAGDFRVDIGNRAEQELRDSYREYYERQVSTAMGDIWKRLHTALEHMSAKLNDAPRYREDKDGNKVRINTQMHATLVPNMLELIDLMGVCNITGDTQMTAIQHQLESTFRGITTDALKEDPFLRSTTRAEVDNVLATINSLPSLDF